MSRTAFAIGLAVSFAAHLCLLGSCSPFAPPDPAEEGRIDTVEIAALAALAVPKLDPPAESPTETEETSQPRPPRPTPVPLKSVRPPAPAKKLDGDLGGQKDGQARPMLRIDWGAPEQAVRALTLGRMKLVALRRDGQFDQQVVHDAGAWEVRPFHPAPGVEYSNALRIVDRVAAFGPAAAAVRAAAGQHRLAVLVPTVLEQKMLAAQSSAAARRGVTLADVHTFGGRFRLDPTGIGFEITQVRMRRSPQ